MKFHQNHLGLQIEKYSARQADASQNSDEIKTNQNQCADLAFLKLAIVCLYLFQQPPHNTPLRITNVLKNSFIRSLFFTVMLCQSFGRENPLYDIRHGLFSTGTNTPIEHKR